MKKYLLMFVICISSFMIYANNVKANTISSLTYSQLGVNNFTLVNSNTWNVELNTTHSWNNWGDSTLIFSFAQQCLDGGGNNICVQGGILPPVVGVAMTTTDTYACELGTTTSYTDSNVLYNLYTVKCRGNFGSNGLTKLTFTLQGVNYVWALHFGSYFTVVQNSSSNADIVTAIQQNNNSQTLQEIKSNINSSINALAGTIENSTNSTNNAINNASSQAHQDSQNINNSINDSSIDNNNTSSSASSWSNKNATNGTITNLLTLPISLLQNILNGIQTTCSSFSLGTLFGTELTFPCINLSDLIGITLFNVIDLLFSGFMILNISKKLIKIFNDFTNLKSNQIDEIYSNGGGAS